ncbi:hypothetical protein [Nocardia bovistercoris]|uniref:Uncharacterized protein n=1 Tax=Nocardia bovistercoris TaxID=2785916 RepID=A0A931IBF3_9NOCA|nr:hypothetical protein [Nocardia bovistercoris]MBH0778269.1 hypothetical protein [Nocardia bovistercoris]
MSIQDDVTLWQHLSNEAKAGRLSLDDSVANQCRAAIERQLDVYQTCLAATNQAVNVTGLGDFECGKELARLLELKAIDPAGDGDLSTALKDHIRVLELMEETIQVSVNRLQQQDSDNAQDLGQV